MLGMMLGNSSLLLHASPRGPPRQMDRPAGQNTKPHRASDIYTGGVILKIGRSAVRPRPWPPSLSPGFEHRPPAETHGGRSAVRGLMTS